MSSGGRPAAPTGRPVVVAPATPPGRGALAVVRFSGDGVRDLLAPLVQPLAGALPPRRARRVRLVDEGGAFDDGVAVFAPGPRSYTGEDTLEVTCHGNPLVVERLVRGAVALGARLADPGEFTRRAVLNGKLDLLQAEAVDQLSRASSAEGLRIGRAALDGSLGAFVGELRATLVEVAAELEARLDYPADELAYLDDDLLLARLSDAAGRCRALAATETAGRALVEGARVALVGPVNAGKSSLFNALLGRRRALVHDAPGTTRDVLEARCRLADLDVVLLDTAGERVTTDPVEAAGLALARELVEEADVLLVVLRASPDGPDDTERAILDRTAARRRLVVYNGVDRPGVAPPPPGALPTSAVRGDGLEALAAEVRRALVGAELRDGDLVIASARQRDLLEAVAGHVEDAVEALPLAGPAVSADAVVQALEELDALTGADTRETVLDALFARFCIGK